jgi:hypothetical protein
MSGPVEDFLEADQPIPGQNYVCLSFVSPEKILKRKELFVAKNFVDYFLKQLKKDNDPYLLDPSKFTPEFIDKLNVGQMFEDYVYANEERLNQDYSKENDYHTTVRGVKIRGVYDTYREAEVRSKVLARKDPNHNVFIGQVGFWLAWDPNPDNVQSQQYANDQLNELVKRYNENRELKDQLYNDEIERRKKRVQEENRKRKEEVNHKPKESEEDSKEKIDKLRKILDDKDKYLEEIMKSSQKSEPTSENDKYSDPWMQRKMEQQNQTQQSSETPENTDNNEEQDKSVNLEDIVKEIF